MMTRMNDSCASSIEGDLRGKFLELVKRSASEEKFIEFISSSLSNKLDFKSLEIILDLTLAVVDQYGYVNYNYFDQHNQSSEQAHDYHHRATATNTPIDDSFIIDGQPTQPTTRVPPPDLSSYDGDDEEFDDTFIFPCHMVYDDCHPELLTDYHREHLKPSRNPIQIIKLPKVCEFVIETMFASLRDYIAIRNSESNTSSTETGTRTKTIIAGDQFHTSLYDAGESRNLSSVSDDSVSSSSGSIINSADDISSSSAISGSSESISSAILDKPMSLSSYLTFVVRLIKKVNKICLNERRNCRILSKTGILSVLLDNIDHLVEVAPDEQHIYLEPLIKFTFTLSDYRISGTNLKQLFKIIKNDETNLSVVLKSLQALLEHHHKILRNIQPSKSMNFPTASRTPEEIEYDRYLANSWHWRLRSKVIENKRRRSRVDSGGQFKPLQDSSASTGRNITSSWLECSLMTPLSNISPLIHNGELKFCCSMWLSVCGDLLVIESNKLLAKRKLTPSATSAKNDKNFGGATGCYDADWAALNGHWLRLTSRRRLVRRHKNMLRLSLKPRKRRLSAKIRTRQAYDQEDEEREEKEEKARKSDAEVTQGHSRSGRGFKLFHSSLRRHPGSSINHSLDKKQDYPYKVGSALGGSRRAQGTIDEQSIYISQPNQHQQNSGSGEATPRPSDHHSQEQLIHMISFALDSLTIEVWLNVKCMTFYARTCRVTREGQTDVHDSVTFRSHLKANGAWSNVIFCLEEENEHNEMKAINLKVIVNGIHEECVRLVYSNHKSPLTNFALLIGCERSTFGYVWKLSQVNLYKNIPDDSMPIYLLGKGPDFWSFTNFRQQSLLPLPDITQRHTKIILNYPEVLLKYSTIDEDQTLNWLTQNIVISYVAHQSEHFLDYSPSMTSVSLMNPLPSDYEFSNSAERFIQAKTLDFSRSLKFNQNNGFGSALVEAGGIESVLMSFAEVVRRSHGSAHQTHALALSVLLKMVQTNLYHLNKFLDELNGLKLIEYVLAHPKCQVSPYMLESYLNFCLIIPDDSTRSLIKSPKLIYHLMTSWRVWHKDAKVAKMLYRRLIKLLHTSAPQIHRRKGQESLDHHYIDHNFRMMSQAGSIDILMDIIRDCLMSADDNSPPYIDHELIDQIVHLISLLISQPPPLDVMLDIMEFLLFLHPDPKAFVELTQDKIGYLHTIEAGGTNDGIAFDYDEDDAEQASGGIRTPYSSTTSDVSDDRDDDDDDSMRSSDVGDDRRRERSSSTGSSKSSESLVCSNRNYAIARIADVLHFTMILPLSHSNSANKTLTEALQKLIIDPRKFIILANNDMPLVREKVLRLFLHFIRACYKSNIRSVLNDYDQATESPNYTICTPIHLMARQLVRYRTTTRMIQLCHGILGGVSEFEAADTYSISFDIETNDIQFQLNTLVLLIQLLTKQPEPKELIAGLRIVHAYIKKLVRIDEEVTVSVIITNDLIDCLMSLYFSYVKKIITSMAHRKQVTTDEEDEDDEVIPGGDDYDALLLELDRLLVFIVRFYLQTKTTNNLVKSLDKLLLYLELINSHIPTQHKQLLRDRMVKVFLTMLKFCNHYELCAKKRSYSGTFQYYFKLMLKNSDLNKFGNELPEFGPSDLIVDENDWPPSPLSSPPSTPSTPSTQPSSQRFANIKGEQDINSSLNYVAESSGNGTSIETAATGDGTEQQPADPMITTHGHLNNGTSLEDSHLACHQREIRESAVIERFKTTFALISSFVTTREPEVIPSPLERGFIMKCVKLLARYLTEIDYKRQNSKQTTQWVSILAKLERFFRACFTRLILYLLAPTSDGMNLDERRYYARQILDQDMFTVDQLLNMLGKSSQSRSHHKILLVFIKDLMTPLEEVNQSEDELPDDTEIKLSELMCGLEARMDGGAGDGSDTVSQRSTRFEMGLRLTSNRWWGTSNSGAGGAGGHEEGGDQKYRAIWLEDLAKAREDLRERVEILKNDIRVGNSSVGGVSGGGTGGGAGNPKQTIAGSSLEDLALSSSDEIDKFLDEAVSITKDVVNDKHEQRKAYLEDVKQNKIYNYHIRQQWLSIIIGHTHERAIWYLEDYYPKSWELNPVEGPSRTRRRLRPCKLKLEERFLRQPSSALHNHLLKQNIFHDESTNATTTRGETDCDERRSIRIPHGNGDKSTTAASYRRQRISQSEGSDNSDDSESADWYSLYSPHPLCSLIINNEQSLDSNELRIRMFTTDKIHFNCDCSIIRPNEVCHGEVSIASWCIHFIGNRSDEDGNCGSGVVTMNDLRVCKLSSSKRFALYQNTSNDRSNKLLATPTTTTVSKLGATGTPQTMINATTTTTVVEDLWFDEIVEIWDRRYQLQEVGLEIFLTNNMTYLLSFRTNADREDFKQNLMREQHKMINLQRFNLATSLTRLTQLWRDAKLTNFDYLTCLNKLAGRSFNDLMQYPVFPFILSNYTSDMLDLDERGNFRNLRKPMAIQNEEREINFKNNYQMSSSSGPAIGSSLGLSKPYHYGNHYSNSATVLHFLVRLPPFTQMLIEYQDNNFDQPDRTFHAMSNTWQLITRDSNTDFKELIPEFFFLPEMFTNIGNLELGRKQNNELVDDVKLPPWCPNSDARLFTLIHRQALESATVSENLHHWIDLIFGYKQTGKHAVEALNVFHPATYYGGIDFSRKDLSRGESGGGNNADSLSAINLSIVTKSAKSSAFGSVNSTTEPQQIIGTHHLSSTGGWNSAGEGTSSMESGGGGQPQQQQQLHQQSPRRLAINKFLQADIERSALETMIKTYGQMPRQLFSSPMKQRSASSFAHGQQQQSKKQRQRTSRESSTGSPVRRPLEPLRQVKGLRWGSYVGSPNDSDVIAVKHKRIILEPVKSNYRIRKETKPTAAEGTSGDGSDRTLNKNNSAVPFGPKLLSKQSDKFHFCLLANGDVAILRNNTSLMLDYRSDRKSSGTYQLSIPSARYSRRAGLSRVSRMNLFSNMIISRQQFSFLEPVHSPSNQFNSDAAAATPAHQSSSLVATLTGGAAGGGSRNKFSLDSLNLVSWFYIDGVVRVKHPAPSNQKPSIPLVQANTIVDTMTTCCSVPELNLLLVGYQSGSICAHIVSTAYETVPIQKKNSVVSIGASSLSGGPSAVHFININSSGSATMDASLLGPGRVTDKTSNGEPYTPLSLAGKTLQSVRSMNKTSRWLYCHDKRINCIKINVSFGIVVTGSDDGTSVIWDLNSLTFVRTIDYKLSSLRIRKKDQDETMKQQQQRQARPKPQTTSRNTTRSDHSVSWTYGRARRQNLYDHLCTCDPCPQLAVINDSESSPQHQPHQQHQQRRHQPKHCSICASGVSLIAISDTLGDIVTIKHLKNRSATASEPTVVTTTTARHQHHVSSDHGQSSAGSSSTTSASSLSCSSTINSTSSESSLSSVIYVHTINGSLVNFVNCQTQVTAVNYSNAPEGISINVVAVGTVDGSVRLYSSWDLSLVKAFKVENLVLPISDIMYTRASQLMYIAYEDGQMVVLRNKKRRSVTLPKEWIL